MQNKIFISEIFRSFAHQFDILFSLLIVSPLVVIYWATSWKISDIFILPENPLKSATISFAVGFSGQFVLIFYQDLITKSLKFEKRKFVNLIVSKIYALFAAQTNIQLWRGTWNFLDMLSSGDKVGMSINIVQNSVILILLKVYKNSLASPFVLMMDQSGGDYSAGTFLNKKVPRNFSWKILRNLLTG